MKKLLGIVVLGLLLSGCFHDPKEIALENCANSSFMKKHPYSYERITGNSLLAKKITKDLDKSFANSNLKAARLNIANSKKTMMEFADENFNLNEDETYAILNKSYNNTEGFSDEVMTLLEMDHDPEAAIDKIDGTKEQKDQFKEIIKDYNRHRAMLKLDIEFREKLTTKLFLEMKMKDKFLEEKYQRLYQRCERTFNELPSSFINKWEHNTELKEFLK